MEGLKLLKTLTIGKVLADTPKRPGQACGSTHLLTTGTKHTKQGQTMEICINESEPEDSINRWAMDTISTGEEAVDVPPHWHKVSGIARQEPWARPETDRVPRTTRSTSLYSRGA